MKTTNIQPTPPRAGFYFGVALLGATLFALGIFPRIKQNNELTGNVALAKEESQVPLVEVVALDAPRPMPSLAPGATPAPPPDNALQLPATVQAIEQTTLNARTTGYLRQRYVDIGSRVKAGQLLAEIESPDVDQELVQAKAQVSKSQAGTGQASADVSRLEAGVEQARADLEHNQALKQQAVAALSHANALLAQNRATVAQAQAKKAGAEQVLEGQKANLVRDKSLFALNVKEWERYQTLVKDGAVAQELADTKQSAFETSQAAVTATESSVRSAEADITAADAQIRTAEDDVLAAQSDITSAEQALRAATAQVASSKANLQAVQASVQASLAGVQAAHAQVGADVANVQRYTVMRSFEKITAPFTGVITARNADAGALINPSLATGLFGLARTDVLRVLVNVPQTYVAAIQAGQKVKVSIRELPGRTFEGTVFSTSGALDPATRTLLTDIRLPNNGNVLLPGMYAEVKFSVPSNDVHAVSIPANTLIINAQGTQVASVDAHLAVHFVPVTPGRDFGSEVEVTAGLTGHERLITNPTDEIKEGMTVKIVAPRAHP
jgi:RND family efflux transporter MFP subunit